MNEPKKSKSDLVKYVSDKTLITEHDANIIINIFLNGIKKNLEQGEKVTLMNFGSFFIQERKPRTALNPKNGEIINVPAKKVVKFKSATKLYDKINK